MPRIDIPELENLPPISQTILQEIRDTGGPVADLHVALAMSEPALAAYWAMRQAVTAHGALPERTRFAVQLAASATGGSPYTRAVNAMLADRAGWSTGEIAAIHQGTVPDDAHLTALLHLTQQAARHRGRIDERTWQAARRQGWSAAALLETLTLVTLVLFVDLVANTLDLVPDVPRRSETA